MFVKGYRPKYKEVDIEERVKDRALRTCFVKAYHHRTRSMKIYNDIFAESLMRKEEFKEFSEKISEEIYLYNPDFKGTQEEAVKWLVNEKFGPQILGISAFTREKLLEQIDKNCTQYVIMESGYDTYACRDFHRRLKIFEADNKTRIEDKKRRLKFHNNLCSKAHYVEIDLGNFNWSESLKDSGYNAEEMSCYKLGGLSQVLSKSEWKELIKQISESTCEESTVIFDFALSDELGFDNNEGTKYSFAEMYYILKENNYLIVEDLDDEMMTREYFSIYNGINFKDKMRAPSGIHYCLAIKYNSET